MTRASTGRNARRGKIGLTENLQRAYNKGRTDLAAQLLSPEGLTMPDGRVARIVHDETVIKDGPDMDGTGIIVAKGGA